MIDGRLIKTSLGTTKYCSHFMKNQQCPKPDCMYLHELGDPEASFTKEEMHQGKHQEYEKRLHDALIAQTAQQAASSSPTPPPLPNSISIDGTDNGILIPINGKLIERSKSPSSNSPPIQSKEAWPSLSTSPISKENKNNKTNGTNGGGGGGKENNNKTKKEKLKGKNKQQNQNNNNNNHNSNKEQNNKQDLTDKQKQQQQQQQLQLLSNSINDDDINSLAEFENDDLSNDGKADTPSLSSTSSSSNNDDSGTVSESASGKSSPGAFPDAQTVIKPLSSSLSSSSSTTSSSSSGSNIGNQMQHAHHVVEQQNNKTNLEKSSQNHLMQQQQQQQQNDTTTPSSLFGNHDIKLNNSSNNIMDTSMRFSKLSLFDDNNSFFSANSFQPYFKNDGTITSNNTTSHLPDLLNGTAETDESNLEREQRDAKLLLKNLSGFHHLNTSDNNSTTNIQSPSNTTTEDWEAAFKYVLMRNNKHLEEQHQQEELLRVQELHKQRNNLVNTLNNMPPSTQHLHNNFNGIDHKNLDYLNSLTEINRLSQTALIQQQQQQRLHNNMQQQHTVQENGHIYPGNMSKFFDFHKNQQNQGVK